MREHTVGHSRISLRSIRATLDLPYLFVSLRFYSIIGEFCATALTSSGPSTWSLLAL